MGRFFKEAQDKIVYLLKNDNFTGFLPNTINEHITECQDP